MKKIEYENRTEIASITNDMRLAPTPHLHKEIELIYVANGYAYACADRKNEIIKTGDLYIAFPNQIHYYEASEAGEYIIAIFSPNILFKLKNTLYNNIPKNNVFHNVDKEIVELLFKALRSDGEYKDTFIAGVITQVMALLMPRIELKQRIKTDNTTLQSILNYCQQNFAEELSLDKVAQALHISKYHISHLFNENLNLNFNTYINIIRIDKACELLEETNYKTSDISEEVGFGSIRTFNRAFLQLMNTTPLQYRSNFRNEKNKIASEQMGEKTSIREKTRVW